jgi:ArsR family transcriptional regulator
MSAINQQIANFFSALADETRLLILISISKGSKTVGDIHKFVLKEGENKITLSAVSHQLKLLNGSDIIEYKKSGREKYYSLSGDFCWCMLKDALKHFKFKRSGK